MQNEREELRKTFNDMKQSFEQLQEDNKNEQKEIKNQIKSLGTNMSELIEIMKQKIIQSQNNSLFIVPNYSHTNTYNNLSYLVYSASSHIYLLLK